jgi:cell division septum initiation protein DivIVA
MALIIAMPMALIIAMPMALIITATHALRLLRIPNTGRPSVHSSPMSTSTEANLDTHELSLGRREGSAFDLVLRGYDREQVEERLSQWADALTQAEEQRNDALTALAQAQARADAAPPRPAVELSDRLKQILVLAEDEASEIRAVADHEVRTAVDRARAEATAVREQAHADLRRDVDAARTEAARVLADAREEAERTLAAAREEAEDVAMDTARTRDEAHEAHEQLLIDQQARHRRETDRLLEEITQLEVRRDEVRAQINRLRDSLSAVGDDIAM